MLIAPFRNEVQAKGKRPFLNNAVLPLLYNGRAVIARKIPDPFRMVRGE